MTTISVPSFTPSLFDAVPTDAVCADPLFAGLRRLRLDAASWIDLVPGWVLGAGRWFDEIVADAPWNQRQRQMYEQRVMEPRLTCGWSVDAAPAPSGEIATRLGERYGVRFDRVAANYYRHGADSVAWHGDRVRFTHPAPVVAIVSLGAPRRFGLRPLGGGRARWLTVAGGDLLVMGGRCQHDWQHTVPKSVSAGARVSVTFRHDDPGPSPAMSEPARSATASPAPR